MKPCTECLGIGTVQTEHWDLMSCVCGDTHRHRNLRETRCLRCNGGGVEHPARQELATPGDGRLYPRRGK